MKFHEAVEHCKRKNGTLALPTSNKDHQLFSEVMDGRPAWVGIYRVGDEEPIEKISNWYTLNCNRSVYFPMDTYSWSAEEEKERVAYLENQLERWTIDSTYSGKYIAICQSGI